MPNSTPPLSLNLQREARRLLNALTPKLKEPYIAPYLNYALIAWSGCNGYEDRVGDWIEIFREICAVCGCSVLALARSDKGWLAIVDDDHYEISYVLADAAAQALGLASAAALDNDLMPAPGAYPATEKAKKQIWAAMRLGLADDDVRRIVGVDGGAAPDHAD